jgi:hypothetical protein
VGLYIENEIELNFLNNSLSYVYYFIPQIRLNFYNDFNLIIGIELYLLAQDVFINKYDMPQYIFKLNYIVSNIKKDIKEKEEKEKVKFVKKKWWQIEGVDDEMIPESWKELDEPESK